jgi:phosphate:Na+ symporter
MAAGAISWRHSAPLRAALREEASITTTFGLLNLMGGVALLLWGIHMVQVGISRAYGLGLRRWLGKALRNPLTGMLAGVGVTVLLQSSTATALLLTTFAARGLIETAPALAVLLGADVGTTLVAQVLTLDLSWLAPMLLLVGVVLHRRTQNVERQDLGRVFVGLGLTLFALRHIVQVALPMRESGVLQAILPALEQDIVIQVLIGALLAWLTHSSLASVLLVISLGATEAISLQVAFALVVGINLGGVFPAVVATLGENTEARRLPFGNLIFKLTGAVVAVTLLSPIASLMPMLGENPARQIANFHTAFNVAIALVFVFLTPAVARLLRIVVPDQPKNGEPGAVHYLDPAATQSPPIAIALAERETLRMGDLVEAMLRRTLEAFQGANRQTVPEIEAMDDAVDHLNEAIKLYLTKVSRETMSEKDSRRIVEIITFATNLEHVGDIIDKNLMELAAKKMRLGVGFSPEGMADITQLHDLLLRHFSLAMNVFMTRDVDMARKLLAAKTEFRDLERQSSERHLARLRSGQLESIDTSSIHLDILRDLKRLNSHVTSVAYPILDEVGELWGSRLKKQG